MQKFTGKYRAQESGTTLCASLRSRNALRHFNRITLYGNLQEKCRAQESAQNADKHFARACAVEMHVNISQAPLYPDIYRKMPRPKTQTHTLREPAQSKCRPTCHKSHCIRKFTGKMPRPRPWDHTLCASKMHVNISKEPLVQEITGKLPRPRT